MTLEEIMLEYGVERMKVIIRLGAPPKSGRYDRMAVRRAIAPFMMPTSDAEDKEALYNYIREIGF